MYYVLCIISSMPETSGIANFDVFVVLVLILVLKETEAEISVEMMCHLYPTSLTGRPVNCPLYRSALHPIEKNVFERAAKVAIFLRSGDY